MTVQIDVELNKQWRDDLVALKRDFESLEDDDIKVGAKIDFDRDAVSDLRESLDDLKDDDLNVKVGLDIDKKSIEEFKDLDLDLGEDKKLKLGFEMDDDAKRFLERFDKFESSRKTYTMDTNERTRYGATWDEEEYDSAKRRMKEFRQGMEDDGLLDDIRMGVRPYIQDSAFADDLAMFMMELEGITPEIEVEVSLKKTDAFEAAFWEIVDDLDTLSSFGEGDGESITVNLAGDAGQVAADANKVASDGGVEADGDSKRSPFADMDDLFKKGYVSDHGLRMHSKADMDRLSRATDRDFDVSKTNDPNNPIVVRPEDISVTRNEIDDAIYRKTGNRDALQMPTRNLHVGEARRDAQQRAYEKAVRSFANTPVYNEKDHIGQFGIDGTAARSYFDDRDILDKSGMHDLRNRAVGGRGMVGDTYERSRISEDNIDTIEVTDAEIRDAELDLYEEATGTRDRDAGTAELDAAGVHREDAERRARRNVWEAGDPRAMGGPAVPRGDGTRPGRNSRNFRWATGEDFKKDLGKVKQRLQSIIPSMAKYYQFIALLLPAVVGLAVNMVGVAAAMGSVAVAGGAVIGLGLLGFGNNLADSMAEAKARANELKQELYGVARPMLQAFAPHTAEFMNVLPSMAQNSGIFESMRGLTAFTDDFQAGFRGTLELAARFIDRMVVLEPILTNLASRGGSVLGDLLVDAFTFLTTEAYANQDAMYSAATVIMKVLSALYLLARAVMYALTYLHGFADIFLLVSGVLSNEYVGAVMAAVAASYLLAGTPLGKWSLKFVGYIWKAIGALYSYGASLANAIGLQATLLGMSVGGLALVGAGIAAGYAAYQAVKPDGAGSFGNGSGLPSTPGMSGGQPMAAGGGGSGSGTTVVNFNGPVNKDTLPHIEDQLEGIADGRVDADKGRNPDR